MNPLDNYTQEYLSGKDLEQTSEQLLNQLHDRQLRKRWQHQLKDKHQLTPQRRKGARLLQLRPWLAVAASLTLLLGVAFWLMPTSNNADQLLSAHLEVPFANSQGRKNADVVNEFRTQAIAAYTERDFEQAALASEKIIQLTDETTQEDFLYLGLSYLYQQSPNVEKAVPHLQKAAEWPNGSFNQESQWYLALAYLKTNQAKKAVQQLEAIIQRDQWMKAEAKELLELLNP